MGESDAEGWISSKELLEKSGISRATLNNYIGFGLLSKPRVATAQPAKGQAPRLGFFPAASLATLAEINRLKRQGVSMAEIVKLLTGAPAAPTTQAAPPARSPGMPPRLTIDGIDGPAYMVNGNLEVEWCNEQAAQRLFGLPGGLPSDIRRRNVLRLLLGGPAQGAAALDELVRLHLSIAKPRMARDAVAAAVDPAARRRIDELYEAVEPVTGRAIVAREIDLAMPGEPALWHAAYASFFREGTLVVLAPSAGDSDSLLDWLGRRDVVIRDVLRRRVPALTPLAVVVADLQDSVKICSELPPEEYFELVNEVWRLMEPLQRQFHATHGKHAGDGVLYYFLPQPDRHHVFNAILCADEMRRRMEDLSRRWRKRKNWLNELRLNIGIDDGEEWFGTYQAGNHLEFTALGDTINRAARLSDLGRDGGQWITKSALARLPAVLRARIAFGIRRATEGGERVLIPASYARVSGLCEQGHPKACKLQDIANLAVTEILDVEQEQKA